MFAHFLSETGSSGRIYLTENIDYIRILRKKLFCPVRWRRNGKGASGDFSAIIA